MQTTFLKVRKLKSKDSSSTLDSVEFIQICIEWAANTMERERER